MQIWDCCGISVYIAILQLYAMLICNIAMKSYD